VLADFEALRTTHGNAIVVRARALAMRLYELLVGQTVHDLRGVLTPLQANVSALRARSRTGPLDAAVIDDGLRKIADRLSYLERFVNDMSTYSQALPCEKSPAVLGDVITDAHNLVLDAIRAAGHLPTTVEVCISVDAKVTVAMARYQIVTAISNVLKNAYDAVLLPPIKGRRGRVAVSVKLMDEEHVCVEVQDNGVGIPDDGLRDLLAFVPGRTTKKGYGTGFGLPIAHRYIAAHGGSVSIASKENDGTTVTITLPSNAQQEADE
jgi:signal transduction histidine kinase